MREILCRDGPAKGKRITVEDGVTRVTFPMFSDDGFAELKYSFCGECLPDGTEIWTEGGAVIRDVQWNLKHGFAP